MRHALYLAITAALLSSCNLPNKAAGTATISQPIGMRNLNPKSYKVSGRPAIPTIIDGKVVQFRGRMTSAITLKAGSHTIRCQECLAEVQLPQAAADVTFNAEAGHAYFTYARRKGSLLEFHVEDKALPGVSVGSAMQGAKPVVVPASDGYDQRALEMHISQFAAMQAARIR